VYCIMKLKPHQIDPHTLNQALIRTFNHKSTELNVVKFNELLESMSQNRLMQDRWISFAKKKPFAAAIPFSEVVQSCRDLLGWIDV